MKPETQQPSPAYGILMRSFFVQCFALIIFTILRSCSAQFDDLEEILDGSDPSKWIVFGSALTSGVAHLGGAAELFIQPVEYDGQNTSALHFAHILSAAIEPPPAEAQMQQHPSGAILVRFIWRQVFSSYVFDTPHARPPSPQPTRNKPPHPLHPPLIP